MLEVSPLVCPAENNELISPIEAEETFHTPAPEASLDKPLAPTPNLRAFENQAIDLENLRQGRAPLPNNAAKDDEEVVVLPTMLGSVAGYWDGGENFSALRNWQYDIREFCSYYEIRLNFANFKNLIQSDPALIHKTITEALTHAEQGSDIQDWIKSVDEVIQKFQGRDLSFEEFKDLVFRKYTQKPDEDFMRAFAIATQLPRLTPIEDKKLKEIGDQIINEVRVGLLHFLESSSDPQELAAKIVALKPQRRGNGEFRLDPMTGEDIVRRYSGEIETLDFRLILLGLQITDGQVREQFLLQTLALLIKASDPDLDRSNFNRVAVQAPSSIPGYSGQVRGTAKIPGRLSVTQRPEPMILPAVLAPRLSNMTTPANRFFPKPFISPAERHHGLGAIYFDPSSMIANLDVIAIFPFFTPGDWAVLRRGRMFSHLGNGIRAFINARPVYPLVPPILLWSSGYKLLRLQSRRAQGLDRGPA